jgi:hypothetical protein
MAGLAVHCAQRSVGEAAIPGGRPAGEGSLEKETLMSDPTEGAILLRIAVLAIIMGTVMRFSDAVQAELRRRFPKSDGGDTA